MHLAPHHVSAGCIGFAALISYLGSAGRRVRNTYCIQVLGKEAVVIAMCLEVSFGRTVCTVKGGSGVNRECNRVSVSISRVVGVNKECKTDSVSVATGVSSSCGSSSCPLESDKGFDPDPASAS